MRLDISNCLLNVWKNVGPRLWIEVCGGCMMQSIV